MVQKSSAPHTAISDSGAWIEEEYETAKKNPGLFAETGKSLKAVAQANSDRISELKMVRTELLNQPRNEEIRQKVDALILPPKAINLRLRPPTLIGYLTFRETDNPNAPDVYTKEGSGNFHGYNEYNPAWTGEVKIGKSKKWQSIDCPPEIRTVKFELDRVDDALRLEYSVLAQRNKPKPIKGPKGGRDNPVWSDWVSAGQSTPDVGRPIVAFRARLRGPLAEHYSLRYELYDARVTPEHSGSPGIGAYPDDMTGKKLGWTDSDGDSLGFTGNRLIPNRRGYQGLYIGISPK